MSIVYVSGFRNSVGAVTYIGNRQGDQSFAPYWFKEEDKDLAMQLAVKAADAYPLQAEVFLIHLEIEIA